ncbi:MAG: ABC transporter permease [Candidatus Limnocylindrales bacterium]
MGLVARQVRYEDLAFWRNPVAAGFTFLFPLIFLLLAQLVLADRVDVPGVPAADFYTPAIVAFCIVNVCFVSIAMSVTLARDEGVLKRIRGTPLSLGAYVTARVIHAVLITLALALIVVVSGGLVFEAPVPIGQVPTIAVVVMLGAATFAALGLAVAGLIPNAHAAPALVNAIVLPLYVISDVLIPIDDGTPVAAIGDLFPVRHLASALRSVWQPETLPLDPMDLAWLAAWGVVGLVVASRNFSWEPRS